MSGQVRSSLDWTGPEQAALCHFDGERALLSQRAKSEHWEFTCKATLLSHVPYYTLAEMKSP